MKINLIMVLFVSFVLQGCKHKPQPVIADLPKSMAQLNAVDEWGVEDSQFSTVSVMLGDQGESRELVSFEVDGLLQYALLLKPPGRPPETGWPLLIFNHGFHPEPAKYGVFDNGKVDRPGEYYWHVPQFFVERGFVVLAPDYRGHNISEGAHFTSQPMAENWYVDDVISSYFAAVKLPEVNPSRVYMLGHSLGGLITQRALILLGNRVNAAAIWSTAKETEASVTMSLNDAGLIDDGSFSVEDYLIRTNLDKLNTPLHIHHAVADKSTSVNNSEQLSKWLNQANKAFKFYRYSSSNHLFMGDELETAAARDLLFFNSGSLSVQEEN